ncbi:site-specific integrase [Actinomadura soli]|uniref:Site-specific integrase n=2 Tax=Actinomadura soli TaxID=2508997 RepID=A0A5C4J0U5_9ACTN|nr:site-specific integrase [Actinomadura soli]
MAGAPSRGRQPLAAKMKGPLVVARRAIVSTFPRVNTHKMVSTAVKERLVVMAREWRDGEMRDGIRKVRNARASKEAGKDVYSFKVPYRDANGKQTSETFTAFKAAEPFRNKLRRQRDEGYTIDPKAGRISVSAYADQWLKGARAKRTGTYLNYEKNVRLYIVPALGGRQLRAVTREDVQAFVNGLDLAPGSARNAYKTLVAMFRSAQNLDKKIPESPCVGIILPEIPDRTVEVLTAAQVCAVAAKMPERWRAAVLLAAGTGLRISEVVGLSWDRIDLDAGTVTVDRQMTPKQLLAPVKTRRSRRVVPLPDMVADALRAHRDEFPPVVQEVGDVDGKRVHRTALVFTRRNGTPANADNVRQPFYRARDAVGLAASVCFHVLRHTYASLLIAAGTHLMVIRDRMGHASIKVTADIYGHLYPAEDDRTRNAIDGAFATDDSGSAPTAPKATL